MVHFKIIKGRVFLSHKENTGSSKGIYSFYNIRKQYTLMAST